MLQSNIVNLKQSIKYGTPTHTNLRTRVTYLIWNWDIFQNLNQGNKWVTSLITEIHKKMTQTHKPRCPNAYTKKKIEREIGHPVEIFPRCRNLGSDDFLHSGRFFFAQL